MVDSRISISINDILYPKLLKSISDPPKSLYVKGNPSADLFENCIAIVGSRKMSPYGARVVNYIIKGLPKSITIVSGFMYGIDTCAHKEALQYGLKTIAVLPCGIDTLIPISNKNLYKEIIRNEGLILSEMDGSIEPKIWTFPKRNRIIAGLSRIVIVVEAGENSGSLITATFAKKFERKVFAVPGSIFSPVSVGTCQLIKEYAEPLISPFDIGSYLHLERNGLDENLTTPDSKVLTILFSQKASIDELALITGSTLQNLTVELMDLQLKGKVKYDGGFYYAC